MSIHSNASSYHSTDTPPIPNRDNPASSIDNSVNEVGFTVLVQNPAISDPASSSKDQMLFKLKQIEQTNSLKDSLYEVVTWQGKSYRLSVHQKKNQLSYTKQDWQKIADKMTQLWDVNHPGRHFSKGTLQLQKKKWSPVFNAKDTAQITKVRKSRPEKRVIRQTSQRLIKDIKNLFNKEIQALNALPESKKVKSMNSKKVEIPSQKNPYTDLISRPSHTPSNATPPKAEKKPLNSIIEKSKRTWAKAMEYLYSLKPNRKEKAEQNEVPAHKKEPSTLERLKKYFFSTKHQTASTDDTSETPVQKSEPSTLERVREHFFPKKYQPGTQFQEGSLSDFDLNSSDTTSIREGSLISEDSDDDVLNDR